MASFLDKSGLEYFYNKLGNIFATTTDVDEVNDKLYSTIAGVAINETTGAMELWSQDLNTVTSTGFYNAMTCTNAKYQYSTLIVIGYYLSGYCIQIQSDVTTGAIATRTQINYVWSAWKDFDIARIQTQSDWNETDSTSEAYILNKPSFDSTPTSGSTNPVTSGGVYTAVDNVASQLGAVEQTDLDNMTTTGIYFVTGVTTNRPLTSYGSWMVMVAASSNGTVIKQLASASTNTALYERHLYNGTWSSWVRIGATT